MKYTAKYRLLLPLIIAAIASSSVAGTVAWTGGGDGHTWGDPANWDGAINDGDSLVIENAASGTTLYLTNDLGNAESPFKLFCITAQGEGSIRISGNPIEPSCGHTETNILAMCNLVTDFDIVFPNHASTTRIHLYAAAGTTWTHNGNISAPGKTALRLTTVTGTINIYGDVTISNGSINVYGNGNYGNTNARWYFYGKCTTPTFGLDAGWFVRGSAYLTQEGNDIDKLSLRCMSTYCSVANVLKPSSIIESYTGGNDGSKFFMQGYDQTIDHLATGSSIATTSNTGNSIEGTGSTLTMKCSVDNTTNDFRFANSVNAVWDPIGDYKCTFRERKHTTSGRITVKRGTMAFLGATEFSALSEIEIAAGAKFSLAEVTTASPLPAIKTIWLENGTTSILALPENRSVANVVVFVDGVPLDAGTYTGADGTAENVVDWIEGKGVVTVVAPTERYFTGVNSSRWSDAGNWSKESLPTNDVETVVAYPGVTVPAGDDVTYNLASFPNAANASTPTFTVRRGGGVTVSGGSLVITNITGKARIGGDNTSVTSRIDVTSGFLGLYATRNDSFAIGKGGVFSMTGGRAEYYYPHGSGSSREWMFRMVDGGMLDLSGNADFVTFMSGSPALVFGTGAVDVRENAQLSLTPSGVSPRSWWSPNAANETLTMSLSGNARMVSACEDDNICGVYQGTKTLVKVSGNAVLALGNNVYIGSGIAMGAGNTGAYGEIDISGCAVVSNRYYAVYVGSKGTEGAISNGKIKMSGGTLQTKAANSGDARGLLVGYGSSTSFADFYNYGTLDLSDGMVNNTSANCGLVVGRGNSYGEVLQSGGTFNQGNKAARVGWYGGTGLYRFTGGTADFSKCDFIVGADGGKGTLEIGSGSGTFTSKNLNLAGSGATLKFKVGADGSLATLGVTDTFTVESDAKLVVDASEYTGKEPVTLMTFAKKDGDFADEDISVITAGKPKYCIKQSDGKLELRAKNSGFMFVVW